MYAALYIRVSTEDQDEYSPDAQKRLLLEYAKKENMTVKDEHIFIESVSGRNAEKRPQFQNMIAYAKSKNRPFDKILVWKFSRFARNQEQSIFYKNMLKKIGIDVISISEPIIDGPFGSLIERIIEWMDEYYSVRLSSEVMRGMNQKALKDGVPASPPYGYRLNNGKYIIENDEADIVRYIFNSIISGMSITKLCRNLLEMGVVGKGGGRWHSKRIKYIINNPAYIGNLRWNYTTHKNGRTINNEDEWIITKNTHEPIVSNEVFEKANKCISSAAMINGKRPLSYAPKHWLAGLLRCSSCGGTLVYNTVQTKKSGPRESFRCNMYNKGACNTPNYIRLNTIENDVLDFFKATLFKLENGKFNDIELNVFSSSKSEKEILTKQLEKIKGKYISAKNAYLAGVDTLEEYKETKESIAREENCILDKIKNLKDDTSKYSTLESNLKTGIEIIEGDTSVEIKNKFVKSFVEKIIVDTSLDIVKVFYYTK